MAGSLIATGLGTVAPDTNKPTAAPPTASTWLSLDFVQLQGKYLSRDMAELKWEAVVALALKISFRMNLKRFGRAFVELERHHKAK